MPAMPAGAVLALGAGGGLPRGPVGAIFAREASSPPWPGGARVAHGSGEGHARRTGGTILALEADFTLRAGGAARADEAGPDFGLSLILGDGIGRRLGLRGTTGNCKGQDRQEK